MQNTATEISAVVSKQRLDRGTRFDIPRSGAHDSRSPDRGVLVYPDWGCASAVRELNPDEEIVGCKMGGRSAKRLLSPSVGSSACSTQGGI